MEMPEIRETAGPSERESGSAVRSQMECTETGTQGSYSSVRGGADTQILRFVSEACMTPPRSYA